MRARASRGLAAVLGLVSCLCAGAACAAVTPSVAATGVATAALPVDPASVPEPGFRNGQEIFAAFRDGLAEPGCDAEATSERWRRQFSHAPRRLADADADVLPLFGYVVGELRAAGLPTEFALIPFVESGYRPDARSKNGPAGLWQFIPTTARNHEVPMEAGYDGRLSAADSTQAAVRYLRSLHGMFGGNWRLAVMAYNAGEFRLLQSLRRSGMNASNAKPQALAGLSPVTYQYVQKLHALACVLEDADRSGELTASLDRPVPVLATHTLSGQRSLREWAAVRDLEPDRIARLNPVLAGTAQPKAGRQVLAPAGARVVAEASASTAGAMAGAASPMIAAAEQAGRAVADVAKIGTHTVREGESAWGIARRYGLTVQALLSGNGLRNGAVLKPGMVLRLKAAEAP